MKDKAKKTYYVNSDLVRAIKIKSAIEEKTETDVLNFILSKYFSESGKEYSFPRKKENI